MYVYVCAQLSLTSGAGEAIRSNGPDICDLLILLLWPTVLDSLGEGTTGACKGLTNLPSPSPRLVESVSFLPRHTRREASQGLMHHTHKWKS